MSLKPNTSGIKPKANKLLVLDQAIDETTSSGIIIAPIAIEKEAMANMYGEVIAMGPMCFLKEVEKRCEVGEKIIFAKYAGHFFMGVDGVKYRLINAEDVIATRE